MSERRERDDKERDIGRKEEMEGEEREQDKRVVKTEDETAGKKVTSNGPIRGGSKKFYVYVKDGDKIKKVSFGDTTGLSIKRDDPARRKSFRARHKCDTAKDKTSARYWSCYQWRANAPVNN